MSSIVFEGNTYNFGATVSANPGTGIVNYSFGGLSSGWTYGFIIWAFNGFGSSSIVGPIIKTTTSSFEEERSIIGAFAWTWEGNDFPTLKYDSGSTLNIFLDSETLSSTWWGAPDVTRTNSGVTLPNGYNNGMILTNPSGYRNIMPTYNLEAGNTYICSFYLNQTLGSGGVRFALYYGDNSRIPPRRQILPQIGSWSTGPGYTTVLLGPTGGESGWIRYAVEFYANFTGNGEYYLPFQTPDISGIRNYYIGSPQLEKVT